jgi:hypothetical protein
MNNKEQKAILEKAKSFFKNTIAKNHLNNSLKAAFLEAYNVNPFLVNYLANFLTGNASPESIAKALVYPRVLGTSITTSFGSNLQKFISEVLKGFGSTTPGIDIEFIDMLDKKKKYCQLKAGPNTINKDDIKTIIDHFQGIKNLARTNNLSISIDSLIVGVIYGTEKDLSAHYKKIQHQYPVIIGKEFWHRLTGKENFYIDLINAFGEVAIDIDATKNLKKIIEDLSKEIKQKL